MDEIEYRQFLEINFPEAEEKDKKFCERMFELLQKQNAACGLNYGKMLENSLS